MKISLPLCSLPLLAAAFVSCDRAPSTIETTERAPTPEMVPRAETKTRETGMLGAAIDAYEAHPTASMAAEAKQAFAKLDGEIAELQERVAKTSGGDRQEAAAKLENLQSYRTAEQLRFTKLQATSGVVGDARSGGEKVEDSARKAGNSVENTAERIGDKVRDAVR